MRPIIFLGMAGVGKTSIAMDIATRMGGIFIDTDDQMMADRNQSLDAIISDIGNESFIELEAKYVQKNMSPSAILAPGGSFIYANEVIRAIRHQAILIYLYDEPQSILSRIPNLETRGIIGLERMSFSELWHDRHEKYQAAAHAQFNINHYGFKKTTRHIEVFLSLVLSD
jgi:shikimate kinase